MNVWNILTALGAILLLGTAGASDCGSISLTHIIIQTAVSLALITVGARGSRARAATRGR